MRDWLAWQEICLIALFSIFIIVTVVGNALIIGAVATTRRLRTVTNCFVMSLAVADWLVGIFVMPLAVASHLMGKWELGWLLCDIWISLDVGLCTASILSLCAISIDRYFAVTQPLNYSRRRRSKRLALLMILFVWFSALAITCPPIFGWYDPERNKDKKCGYNQNRGYVIFSAMGSFFVPLTVMLYVYARISCVIAKRHVNLDALNNGVTTTHYHARHYSRKFISNHEESDLERGSSESEEAVRIARLAPVGVSTRISDNRTLRFSDTATRVSSFKRESKTAQTLSIVVGGFIACWLPFFVVYLASPFLEQGTIPQLLMTVLTWLGWLNSAINPFIYAFYSPDFRLAFWRLTLRHCSSKPRGCKKQSTVSNASRLSVHLRDNTCYSQYHRP
ncbi:putative G-protein coupled receptor No18 [Lycorma delicatula]|uniref:putative G-protein coupled receptor No18 n=1 Tax=Lycorma delicatula TaxID=130591 RepID=UPI003F50E71F